MERTLSKAEAMAAMLNGDKIRHRHFASNEWMKSGTKSDIEFEDGCQCSLQEFWRYRVESSWDTGWSVVGEVSQ